MYDEAVEARFVAHCGTHPAWFAEGFLAVMAGLADLDLVNPAQLAWRIMLDRYVGERDSAAPEDVVTGPIGWRIGD